jgi:hypothetical protein
MVELISFDGGKLGPELLENKFISFGSIIVIENERMTKVKGVGGEIRDWKDVLDGSLALLVHTLAEKDGGFREIGVWPEALQKERRMALIPAASA